MSDVLLSRSFDGLETFCKISKKRRIILSERETFPVYKMKITQKGGVLTTQIDFYRKKKNYNEEYEEYFRIRFKDITRGIGYNQVGIFYLPMLYEDGDPRNELVPAIVFDKDTSIYDDNYVSYFDEGSILQDLLIKLLNKSEEVI